MARQLKNEYTDEEIREAFKVFDRDGRGVLNAIELRHALTTIGEPLTEQEADDLFKAAEIGNDGLINYEQFIQILTQKI